VTRAPLLLVAMLGASAGATPFSISITNTTASPWSAGLLTLQPMIALGLTPQPGRNEYFTYAFATTICQQSDSFCTAPGCDDTGNPTVLAARWHLTLGTSAWLVPALAAGASATVVINATSPQRVSYISQVTGSSDDFVALHEVGSPATLSAPLFNSSGQPLGAVVYDLGGYDANTTVANDGDAASCSAAVCPTPTAGCFVSTGNGTTGATLKPPNTLDVTNFTAISAAASNRLVWTNVAPHSGVVIARRSLAVTWTPTAGAIYTVGQVVSTGANPTTIAYADDGVTAAAGAMDTGLTNGTRYFYKVFAHANSQRYAAGSVPASTGLFSDPTPHTGANPAWCYSVGFPSMQQPVTKLGTAIFTASNGGALTANRTTPANAATDGDERWRPVQLQGAVQNRPLMVPTQLGDLLITGDQTGHAYAVNPASGRLVWTANGGAVLGDRIQGQPIAQLNAYEGSFGVAGTTFLTNNPGRDLIFIATRNSSTTSNKVYGLSSLDGSVVWTYAPGDLDIISGGMAVNYLANHLYVAAHNGLRILSSVTGKEISRLLPGIALDQGVNLDFSGGTAVSAFTISSTGTAYGINLATRTLTWTAAVGATSTWIYPTGNGFLASLKAGGVRRYGISGSTVTLLWTASPAVPTPNGATVDYAHGKVYVGSADGRVRQIDFNTGLVERTLTLVTTAPTDLGFPTIDATAGRLHVGTMDGRLCAVPIPLP
jgi:hypothetical protein